MNIWGIDMGHPDNCGAKGFMSETDGNRAVGRILMANLKALGDKVIDCTIYDNNNELERRVAKANAQKLDYFISLHLDSFSDPNSNGVTIYTTEGSSTKEKAREVINLAAASCGYHNRGLKFANFYVLKHTNAPAMLIEMGFVSNQGDCNKFNAKSLADAITKGLTGLSVATTPVVDNSKYKLESDLDMTKKFSGNYYGKQNPDVVKAYGSDEASLYKHYVDFGKKEGRLPLPPLPKGFIITGYLMCNKDLQEALNSGQVTNVLNHFYDWGWSENREYIYKVPVIQVTNVDDSNKETFYRVVTGSYKERVNADEQIAKLKKLGCESFVDIFKK